MTLNLIMVHSAESYGVDGKQRGASYRAPRPTAANGRTETRHPQPVKAARMPGTIPTKKGDTAKLLRYYAPKFCRLIC